jgi:hypothetical protein
MAYTTRIKWETLRVFDSATLSGAYQALGTAISHPAYIVKMVNNSTATVTVSIDGATDIDVCPASSFWLYDEYKSEERESLPSGTQFFIKGTAGTGSIYLVVQYLQTS